MKYLFFFMMLFNSCSQDEANDDKLSINKTQYNGNELRIDGYYYMQYDFDMPYIQNGTFFYNNGILLNIGGREETLNLFENNFLPSQSADYLKNTKSRWGLFKIEGSSLYYERWYPKSFGSVFKVFSHECEILNDTTYIVKKQYRLVNGQQTEVTYPNHTYHFVEFANKPSSENNFIP